MLFSRCPLNLNVVGEYLSFNPNSKKNLPLLVGSRSQSILILARCFVLWFDSTLYSQPLVEVCLSSSQWTKELHTRAFLVVSFFLSISSTYSMAAFNSAKENNNDGRWGGFKLLSTFILWHIILFGDQPSGSASMKSDLFWDNSCFNTRHSRGTKCECFDFILFTWKSWKARKFLSWILPLNKFRNFFTSIFVIFARFAPSFEIRIA